MIDICKNTSNLFGYLLNKYLVIKITKKQISLIITILKIYKSVN